MLSLRLAVCVHCIIRSGSCSNTTIFLIHEVAQITSIRIAAKKRQSPGNHRLQRYHADFIIPSEIVDPPKELSAKHEEHSQAAPNQHVDEQKTHISSATFSPALIDYAIKLAEEERNRREREWMDKKRKQESRLYGW